MAESAHKTSSPKVLTKLGNSIFRILKLFAIRRNEVFAHNAMPEVAENILEFFTELFGGDSEFLFE